MSSKSFLFERRRLIWQNDFQWQATLHSSQNGLFLIRAGVFESLFGRSGQPCLQIHPLMQDKRIKIRIVLH